MKIIDLLNKIANGEEVPENIVFETKKYKYSIGIDYINEDGDYLLSSEPICISFLNTEIEILDKIPEEKKIPEKLELPSFIEFKTMSPEARYVVTAKEYDVLNDIIDYIKSKGE